MLGAIEQVAEVFTGIFQQGAEFFTALVTGILPLIIVLLTAVNALIKFIGIERVNKVAELAGKEGIQYAPLRFLVLPVLAVFFLTNPACYSMGTFLPERNKPAFYDSAVSFVHPPLGLLPHVNPGELFVWAGIASGVEMAGNELTPLAVRYLLVGLIVIFIRGLVTQFIYDLLASRADDTSNDTAAAAA
ncbi:PTS glucitol/sorbitol transporter subunit IIC [Euzebya tangerina]|uniref:PTS glucitol/sorbitol transporter subunit IIC n=1 Tax=Euzebya tangerina TaxID=591198 RepID=UPI001F0B8F63|nr:PTS glucitol/sorbitol transporter subunit IIC [Euzebya tangerina]